MLIDFTVENYRSIKGAVTLSAIAQSGREHQVSRKDSGRDYIKSDSDIAPTYPIEGRGFEVLPVLGIFGANASGKSNILKALDQFLYLMQHGTEEARHLASIIIAYKLDAITIGAPTRFQLRIILANIIYTYTLVIHDRRILEEKLEQVLPPPARNQQKLLFSRLWLDETRTYQWENKNGFEGPHTQLQKHLSDYQTFLGFVSSNLNLPIIKHLSNWLKIRWPGINLGRELDDHILASWVAHEYAHERVKISNIIRLFDTGIADIEIKKNAAKTGESDEYEITTWHETEGSKVALPFDEESVGTQRLFSLACKVLATIDHQSLLLIDELGSNIHPRITREMIRLFQNPKTNPKRAQLIFTSHDNTLQQRNVLRRDQIWFTEKRSDGSTDLYPLTDFKPRNDLAIDKAYLDGRFGAVPILPDTEDLLSVSDGVLGQKVELVS